MGRLISEARARFGVKATVAADQASMSRESVMLRLDRTLRNQ